VSRGWRLDALVPCFKLRRVEALPNLAKEARIDKNKKLDVDSFSQRIDLLIDINIWNFSTMLCELLVSLFSVVNAALNYKHIFFLIYYAVRFETIYSRVNMACIL